MVTSSSRGLRSTTQGPKTHHRPSKDHQKSRGSEVRRHAARLGSFNGCESSPHIGFLAKLRQTGSLDSASGIAALFRRPHCRWNPQVSRAH